MESEDGGIEEPFKLEIGSIQGRWICEELGATLTVSGNMVQYASGECYPIEVSPGGKLEIFGYRALGKKSDASMVVWKHKETSQLLTWMYEGDSDEIDPDVDPNLIIETAGGRSSRKRKIDYVALDKELASEEAGKQGQWQSKYEELKSSSTSSSVGEHEIENVFLRLKKHFQDWVSSSDSDKCKIILSKRGYLSTELHFGKSQAESAASSRFINFVKSTGAKAMVAQGGSKIHIRVPESTWEKLLLNSRSESPSTNKQILSRVTGIRDEISSYCEKETHDEEDRAAIEKRLSELEKLPIDLEVLKDTKIGVEINRLSKLVERAKLTLVFLKNIYLESKKNS